MDGINAYFFIKVWLEVHIFIKKDRIKNYLINRNHEIKMGPHCQSTQSSFYI